MYGGLEQPDLYGVPVDPVSQLVIEKRAKRALPKRKKCRESAV